LNFSIDEFIYKDLKEYLIVKLKTECQIFRIEEREIPNYYVDNKTLLKYSRSLSLRVFFCMKCEREESQNLSIASYQLINRRILNVPQQTEDKMFSNCTFCA